MHDAEDAALALIALGSNLGDAVDNVGRAIQRLRGCSDHPLRASGLWETAPVECPPGSPRFINAAVALRPRPDETPESLLAGLQALEREFGRRVKQIHNEARPLDLDLIAFGGASRDTPELTLPHPRAVQRRFVLLPLCELVPGLILPGQIKTVAELLESLPPELGMERVSAGRVPEAGH
jgi:2-amino-4-hydroxy-6-hydroxymethyldihydropteridine diphosphokinase